ncbi:Putative mitochondrial carrier protein PET8 [Durusdinium trenchii]|uniref:Mitochondrial carrier protein PET8 n=1 Tax=Durusdinium trenchii TaxID=1381693 RepID=A0ABP0K2N4_9DINO
MPFSLPETSPSRPRLLHGPTQVLAYCGIGLVASILGELAAGVWRVPVDLVKQRQQAGGGQRLGAVVQGVVSTQGSIFVASLQASLLRDVTHSSLQFPMYEYLKLVCANLNGISKESLPTWQAASCGTVAGVISAFLSTPLDVLRTRLNLREDHLCPTHSRKKASQLLKEEALLVYRGPRGFLGFFAGCTCRAAWMGLGGFIFLGSFELAKMLRDAVPPGPRAPSPASPSTDRQLGSEPPVLVSFSCGLSLCLNGGWMWLSAVLAVSLPGSALFFVLYESSRHFLERRIPVAQHDKSIAMSRDAVAASVADVGACVVRVPCEVLKQRMQALGPCGVALSFTQTVSKVWEEGVRGFFAGFAATAMRSSVAWSVQTAWVGVRAPGSC